MGSSKVNIECGNFISNSGVKWFISLQDRMLGQMHWGIQLKTSFRLTYCNFKRTVKNFPRPIFMKRVQPVRDVHAVNLENYHPHFVVNIFCYLSKLNGGDWSACHCLIQNCSTTHKLWDLQLSKPCYTTPIFTIPKLVWESQIQN